MRNTILPVALLVLFTSAAFAQRTCDLSIESVPMIGKFKVGMTIAQALKAFPKMPVQEHWKGYATSSFVMGDKAYSLNFIDDQVRSMGVLYPEPATSNIDDFAALVARDLKLPDAWTSTVSIVQNDHSQTAYDSRVMQCRDFAIWVSIPGEKRNPDVIVMAGTFDFPASVQE
jgi:hypothetical protein